MLRGVLFVLITTAALATPPERSLEPPSVGAPIHPLPPPVVPTPAPPAVPVVAKPLPAPTDRPLTAVAPPPAPPSLASTPAELNGSSERAALLRLGENRRKAGDLAGAEAAYRAVIQLSPEAAQASTAIEALPGAAPLGPPPVQVAKPPPPAPPAPATSAVPPVYPALVALPAAHPVMTRTIRVYGYRVGRRHRHRHRWRRHRRWR